MRTSHHKPADFSLGCCTTQLPALWDSEPSAMSLPTHKHKPSVANCWLLWCSGMLLSARNTVGYARTNDPTTKKCYNEQFLANKISMLQRTQMLQRTRKNTVGRRSTRVRMTCRAFPLWLESQSSSFLSFVRFSYHFSSVIYLLAPLAVKIFLFLNYSAI